MLAISQDVNFDTLDMITQRIKVLEESNCNAIWEGSLG